LAEGGEKRTPARPVVVVKQLSLVSIKVVIIMMTTSSHVERERELLKEFKEFTPLK
jgi:hypothetical protein